MNRDEILAMKPGPELDALVAEKVMGYITHGQFREKNGVRVMIDRYSADIAAAWEVVGKFFWVQVTANPPHIWKATVITSPAKGSVATTAKGFTAPEAICKAALLVVGVNGE